MMNAMLRKASSSLRSSTTTTATTNRTTGASSATCSGLLFTKPRPRASKRQEQHPLHEVVKRMASTTTKSQRDRHAARAMVSASETEDPQPKPAERRVEETETETERERERETVKVEYLETYRNNVGLCVVNREGLVFAAVRKDDPTGAWQMPQGGIDKGEFARESAFRELEEETGIAPEHVEIIGEVQDWLAYEFPTSVRERIANRFVKRHLHMNGDRNGKKKFRQKVYKGQRQKWFLMRFFGKESDIDLAPRGEAHREFSEWRWIPLNQLPDQVVVFKREVYEQVDKEFSPLIEQHFQDKQA